MIGRGVSVILIVLILYSSYMVLAGSEYQRVNLLNQSQTELAVPSDIEYNSSVSILSDSDFVKQNWPGNGTEGQPYVISNLRFSNTENLPIRICNTRAYFLVINCVVESLQNYPRTGWGNGIILSNVTNGIVEGCSIDYMNAGVYLSNANNTIVRNNLIVACDTGISINSLDRCTISNNSIRMGFEGITGHGLRHSNLTESMIVESHIGLYLNAYCINNT
ncbi:MAG: NosD domain-containing protein, partial [Candidatus Sifarchaeia archaeon]